MNMNPTLYKRLSCCIALVALSGIWSCASETQTPSNSAPPAKVENAVKESELTTVTLSPEAEQRLGVATHAVELRHLPRVLKLGGEIVAPPGRRLVVTAPAAGIVLAPNAALPQTGASVRKGQTIFRLLPLPSNQDLLGTPDEVALKQMQFEVAQAKAQRAAQLLLDKAGSVRAKEEAEAEMLAAEAAYKAAEARLQLTKNTAPDSSTLALATMSLAAPFDGVIQRIDITPRQTVSAGTALFEVASQNPIWVRIPIYVGDLAKIDAQQPVQVAMLGETSGSSREARPVQGPPFSDAHAASADLFYEMKNDEQSFRLGQKVEVALAQKSATENLVVPFSAILYDIHGGEWVYEQIALQKFARRRVEVRSVVNGNAILARGPKPGAQVVIAGAAEIFGTEFGSGK